MNVQDTWSLEVTDHLCKWNVSPRKSNVVYSNTKNIPFFVFFFTTTTVTQEYRFDTQPLLHHNVNQLQDMAALLWAFWINQGRFDFHPKLNENIAHIRHTHCFKWINASVSVYSCTTFEYINIVQWEVSIQSVKPMAMSLIIGVWEFIWCDKPSVKSKLIEQHGSQVPICRSFRPMKRCCVGEFLWFFFETCSMTKMSPPIYD